MVIGPDALRRLSVLLDTALELPESERATWLARLTEDDASLAPTLRDLLARQASQETADLLDRPPGFTVAGPVADATGQREGDTVGPYRLERALGRGGMGEVWLAARVDGSLKRKVALKLPHVTWAPGLAERFAREREILSGLEHPNVARLYDAGVDAQGRPYMALEYVEGQPLDEFCKAGGLSIEGRLKLLLQVADAVAFAHSRLVVHRDLKPGNMLVTTDGQVRLLDFGIAKLMEGDRTRETALTQMSGRALTLDYASPEQIRGEPIGTASDVYSLGVVAFELLAGVRPYRLKRGSAAELEEAIAHADSPLASEVAGTPAAKKVLKGDLDAILNKALKKDPNERYATVDALAQDWRRHLAGQGVTARPDTVTYRLTRFVRQYRLPLTAAGVAVAIFVLALGFGATAVVIVALLLGLGGALWQARKAREQARAARIEGRKAQAVKRFLLDIFEANSHMQDDPLKAQQTTARELLDIGVQRVEQALRDEPEARLEVLESLAEIYHQIGLRLEAARLHQLATDLARAAYGPQDLRFARVALHCARALNSTPLRDRVPRLLDEARLALDAGPDDPELRACLLHDLTTHYRYESLAKALPPSEEAASLVERTDLEETPNIYRVAARMQMMAGRYDRAEQFLRQSISAAEKHGDAGTVNGRIELAHALNQQGRVTEAEAHARKALALSERYHGPQHRWTLFVLVRLSNLLFETGQGGEAAALRDQCERTLLQDKPEYDAMFRADMAENLARCLSARGRPDLSEPLERADLADLEQHFPHSSVRAQREAELADIALVYGRFDDAKCLIDAAIARWDRFLGGHGTPALTVHCKSVAARLHIAHGRLDDAASCLSGVDWPTRAGVGRFSAAVLQGVAQRAEVETLLGRPVRAQALADAELSALQEHLQGAQLPGPTALLLLARGNARRATGDLRGAESDLRAALELRLLHDDHASLWLAEVEVTLASCLIAMDGREEAQTLLAETQKIYLQHEGLSSRFLLPLEQALEAIRS